MSERLSDAADSAEPAPPRQASGDGAPRRPAEEPPVDGSSRPTSAGGPQARSRRHPPAQSPPATSKPAQSPPAGGPPQRSALSEKARAIRPRRTAADVAREAAGKAPRGPAAPGSDDAEEGRDEPGRRRDGSTRAGDRAGAAEQRRDGGTSASDRRGDGGTSASDRRGDGGTAASDRHGDGGTAAGERAAKRGDSAGRRAGRGSADGTGRGRTGAKDAPERERPGGPWPMPDRSLMATVLGINPALAVGGAAALTAVGVAIDLLRVGTLSTAFTICYLAGCVLATGWVRRSGVFWPMVAPPLLMALAVPVVVLVAGTPRPGAGIAQRLLVIGAPLVNGFPMMAWTTGLVLALGLFRLITQRERPERGAARAGGRTSTSPRRS